MKFDFFSVLIPIALTSEKAAEFIIHSSDRLVIDAITALIKTSSFLRQALFLKIVLKQLVGFLQSFPNLIQAAGTFSVQKDLTSFLR